MQPQHETLAAGRWREFSLSEQLANVGSEIERTVNWKKKQRADFSERAFFRALELLGFTICDPKNKKSLRELTRVREALIDHFVFENEYQSSDEQWQKYFYAFNLAVRLNPKS